MHFLLTLFPRQRDGMGSAFGFTNQTLQSL